MSINYRRKFRSQTSDNMARWKRRGGKSQRGEEQKREDQRRERVRRKKCKCANRSESRETLCFSNDLSLRRSKSRLAKAAGAEHVARWEMNNCTPSRREAHFQVKMYKTHQLRTTFGSWDVEKVHAVVARSKFPSQNVQSAPFSDHFWKLRCRKSARRCGAKHISKSTCTKHVSFGTLLEVEVSKKCTPLWREAHFQVKSVKHWRSRTTFGRSDVVSRGRRAGFCTWPKVSKTTTLHYSYNYNYTTLRDTTRHDTTLHWLHYTTLRYPTLHPTTLTTTTLHYTKLITLHYVRYTTLIALHYTTLHYTTATTTLHYTPLHYTQFHYTTLITTTTTLRYTHYILLHCTTLHHTTPHHATLHYANYNYSYNYSYNYATVHYSTLDYNILHYPTLHYTTLITPPQLQLQLHYIH